jgi:streptogramin lyase
MFDDLLLRVLAGSSMIDISTSAGKLSISNLTTDYGFLWVPCSDLDTLVKINTKYPAQSDPFNHLVTQPILGYYKTSPDRGDPSRTAVDADGNVWVGHRSKGDVVRVGLFEKDQCVDRNGDGVITTSRRLNPNDDYPQLLQYNVIDAPEDECITHRFDGSTTEPGAGLMLNIRAVAVDKHSRVWFGCTDIYWPGRGKYHMSFLPDPLPTPGSTASATLLGGSVVKAPFQCNGSRDGVDWGAGGYGYVIDDAGVLWSSSYFNPPGLMRFNTSSLECLPTIEIPNSTSAYGLAIDRAHSPNVIYTDSLDAPHLWSVTGYDSTSTNVTKVTEEIGGWNARGVAVGQDGDIWVASTNSCSLKGGGYGCFITRVNKVTGAVTYVRSYGNGPTGVAVDSNGKIWFSTVRSHTAERIDPATNQVDLVVQLPAGCRPYTYGQ